MRVEIVAIGTELLLGQIADTNSEWMGEQLAMVGLDSFFQTKVGDNQQRMVDTISLALDRSDAVICCGGLGPTQDDLTRNAIAAVMGVPLVADEEMEERIIGMFSGRTRRMPANNLRQAEKPESATFISEMPGTAPGLVCELQWPRDGASANQETKVIYAVPGVPWEMKEMIAGTVLSDIQRRGGIEAVIRSRTLRTWGESESGLAELLAERISELDSIGNPTIAFLASGVEGLKVRITAKAPSADEAETMLASEEKLLLEILGPLVFGIDDESMESSVISLLKERGLTLGVGESLTGGMIGSRICDVPGASEVFKGSIVSYATDVKQSLLNVPEGPVITEAAALAMAKGARMALGSDVGISATGVAGPDTQEDRPAGTVCLAVSIASPTAESAAIEDSIEIQLPGRRKQVREFTVISLLGLLRRRLIEADPS